MLSILRPLSLMAIVAISAPLWATSYFISPTGNDSNNGLSTGAAWLSPLHAISCGDTITAASGTYSYTNFTADKWGVVTCAANNNVAWLICATFDACKIASSGGNPGMYVSASYWGVQGWEVTVTASTYAGCFLAVPSFNTNAPVHHIIFANNIANGCFAGGFGTGISSTGSADYVAFVGNIAYNAAAGSNCYSNINVFQPINHDTLPGTHIYIAGNFSFGALNTNPCGGGIPSDGEGINIDSMNFTGDSTNYSGQVVVDNNISVANGGRGIEVEYNNTGSPNAHVYVRHNTVWGNSLDPNQSGAQCGEFSVQDAQNVESYSNIVQTGAGTGCMSNPIYALQILNGDGTDHIYNSWGYSAAGNNSLATTSTGFSFGPGNTLGTNAVLANPVAPGAPSCGSFASVPACMATVIANFKPTLGAASTYGYQPPVPMVTFDPLFPQWLCTSNIPSGLVTMGCLTGSAKQ